MISEIPKILRGIPYALRMERLETNWASCAAGCPVSDLSCPAPRRVRRVGLVEIATVNWLGPSVARDAEGNALGRHDEKDEDHTGGYPRRWELAITVFRQSVPILAPRHVGNS